MRLICNCSSRVSSICPPCAFQSSCDPMLLSARRLEPVLSNPYVLSSFRRRRPENKAESLVFRDFRQELLVLNAICSRNRWGRLANGWWRSGEFLTLKRDPGDWDRLAHEMKEKTAPSNVEKIRKLFCSRGPMVEILFLRALASF
jgi:hypothetical protein